MKILQWLHCLELILDLSYTVNLRNAEMTTGHAPHIKYATSFSLNKSNTWVMFSFRFCMS